jgi:ABC-type transporter Mla subunit MlaD
MARGFKRIEKVVGRFQKLIDEVNLGIKEVEQTIEGNNAVVDAAERAFNALKEVKDEENAILNTSLTQGKEIAKNIDKLLGK